MTRLNRTSANIRPPAPVRAVHLGLGAFHRAHQAVYTAADPDWGIAAYTFRSTELPHLLTEQEGVYSLQIRGGSEDRGEIVDSISRAHPGCDTEQWLADLASPEVALLTLTITEAAYYVRSGAEDTALGRILAGLQRRYHAGGAPLAIVPCDNVAGNGAVLRSSLQTAAAGCAADFRAWLSAEVSFVDTVVDRITPAITDRDLTAAAELTGLDDRAPVVTESFSEWLLAGEFPLGRPEWEKAGARFVDDLAAYQQRKLWFLNGAHTLLSYTGPAVGCATIDQAVRHPMLAELMESWWDTASRHASLPTEDLLEYRQRLRQRFAARGIQHDLRQIAADGSQKIPARILPVLRSERRHGRLADSAVAALAGWLLHLRSSDVRDPRATELGGFAGSPDSARRTLAALDPELAEDHELVLAVEDRVARLESAG
ncbi:mannitol dehydrogenase family protein [Bounagaea algeriensis]